MSIAPGLRTRDAVVADLMECNYLAKRMICVDEDYEDAHDELNRLLTEMQQAGMLRG